MKCTLCGENTRLLATYINKDYFKCGPCGSVLMSPEFYLTPEAEEKHYLSHNNDINDPRYKNFVSPVTSAISGFFKCDQSGLDYGCGTGPVAAVELEKLGYTVKLFDPFFHNFPDVLDDTYHFVICCEVMEHFHNPHREFELLYNLLKPGGKLYCKTSLYTEDLDFRSWYYKNDPTHVFLYSPKSLEWIKTNFGFKGLSIEPKLITFEK